MVGVLLEKGADPALANEAGQTPLFFAKPELAKKYGLHTGPVFYGNPAELVATQDSVRRGKRMSTPY